MFILRPPFLAPNATMCCVNLKGYKQHIEIKTPEMVSFLLREFNLSSVNYER